MRRCLPAGFARLFALVLLSTVLPGPAAELRVPAFTAYFDPDPHGARMSERDGVRGWRGGPLKVQWFGRFETNGPIEASVDLRVPEGTRARLRLTVAGTSREVEVTGQGTNRVTARFGGFTIPAPGFHALELSALGEWERPGIDVEALRLDGTAVAGAHFNLKPRRNAASVHLSYPFPKGTNVAAFYCEATGVDEPTATYYMACGWHRGYFGMQVNSPTERRIIFSVWDSGKEAIRRSKVAESNRVMLVAKGEEVHAGDFGNEGTGGHSHLKYPWKTGQPQRFLVTAQPTNGTFTIYSGWWFHPERGQWMLISSWRAPRDGGWLRGLYSFSENFDGSSGHRRRKALFGNQWVRTDAGEWLEITQANFSHDGTGKADRLDRFMGVENGRFFLSHGGFVAGYTKAGEPFLRPPVGTPPADLKLDLPTLP